MPPHVRVHQSPAPHAADTAPSAVGIPAYCTVCEVLHDADHAVQQAFRHLVWVKGEVTSYKGPNGGHHYFDLVEHRPGQRNAVLPAAIWESRWPAIAKKLRSAGMDIRNGQEVLFRGRPKIFDGSGRLTFHVDDVLPEFTLGQIEMQRKAVLDRLTREGLCEQNKRHRTPELPLRIGVVTSLQAAGWNDFAFTLKRSGYAFRVYFVNVPVQGTEMEAAVCRALTLFAEHQEALCLDLLCVIRGGGSAIDLGWWNSYPIAATIARMPLPVISAIGHQQDRVAIDEVVHTRTATPTAAAEMIVQAVQQAETALNDLREVVGGVASSLIAGQERSLREYISSLVDFAYSRLSMARTGLQGHRTQLGTLAKGALAQSKTLVRHSASDACTHAVHALRREVANLNSTKQAVASHAPVVVAKAQQACKFLAQQLEQTASFQLRAEMGQRERLQTHLSERAPARLSDEQGKLEQLRQLVEAHDPQQILKRGYSITCDASGKAIKDAASLEPGATIVTRLDSGQVQSTVTKINPRDGGPHHG